MYHFFIYSSINGHLGCCHVLAIVNSATVNTPSGSVVNNLPTKAGDEGLIPGWGRSSGEGNGTSILAGKFHGQWSLVGYSPWIAKSQT